MLRQSAQHFLIGNNYFFCFEIYHSPFRLTVVETTGEIFARFAKYPAIIFAECIIMHDYTTFKTN